MPIIGDPYMRNPATGGSRDPQDLTTCRLLFRVGVPHFCCTEKFYHTCIQTVDFPSYTLGISYNSDVKWDAGSVEITRARLQQKDIPNMPHKHDDATDRDALRGTSINVSSRLAGVLDPLRPHSGNTKEM